MEKAIPMFLTVIYSAEALLKILYNRVCIYTMVSVLAMSLAVRNRDLPMKIIIPSSFCQESYFILPKRACGGSQQVWVFGLYSLGNNQS